MRLRVPVVLCWLAVACGDSHAPDRGDASLPGDDTGGRDGGTPHERDASSGRDAAPADAGPDATIGRDAMVPLPEGGLDPDPGWPDEAALAASLDDFDTAACQVDLDLNSDGTIDQRWAYEYEDGRLARTLVWLGTEDSREIEVIVHRDDGREWARCNAVACELVRYRSEPAFDPTVYCPEVGCLVYIELAKGHEVERSVFATPDDDALLRSTIEQFDEQGRLRQRYGVDFGEPGKTNFAIDMYDEQGRLVEQSFGECESCDEKHEFTYHANGALAESVYRGDPDTRHYTCDEHGWELTGDACDEPPYDCTASNTEYSRDAQGLITTSHSIYEENALAWSGDETVSHAFTTQWTWNASRTAVALVSSDDLAAWSKQHAVVVEPPPPAIVHVGSHEDRIEIDLDADGTPDAAHTLHYTETAACTERRTPALAELPLDLPVVNRPRCKSPVPDDIGALYSP